MKQILCTILRVDADLVTLSATVHVQPLSILEEPEPGVEIATSGFTLADRFDVHCSLRGLCNLAGFYGGDMKWQAKARTEPVVMHIDAKNYLISFAAPDVVTA